MATVTSLTAARMQEIEAASVIDGEVVDGDLILTTYGGTKINAGPVVGPQGPQGPVGPASVGAIPGEVKLWPGSTLPDLALYGKWVWADGAYYPSASHPKAAAHIAPQWRTFAGASDPGAGNFRVPDLRGLVASGMDAMPGGVRANRMTRSVAITIAARTGEELHRITVPEMPAHAHGVNDPTHGHGVNDPGHEHGTARGDTNQPGVNAAYPRLWEAGAPTSIYTSGNYTGISIQGNYTGISIQNNGGDGYHENVQPTVFVPYIVFLDVV